MKKKQQLYFKPLHAHKIARERKKNRRSKWNFQWIFFVVVVVLDYVTFSTEKIVLLRNCSPGMCSILHVSYV